MTGSIRKGGHPALPPDAQARIGAKLRQMYDSVVQAPVPDRFAALLEQLEAATPFGPENSSGDEAASRAAPTGDASPPGR